MSILPSTRRCFLALALLILPVFLSGCWLFAADERVRGKPIAAEYLGLEGKSVAIIVYTERTLTNEFPAAREEISGHIAREMHQNMLKTRLLDPKEVIAWQDETINWFGLSEKDLAKHFGVDRIVWIELLSYTARPNGAYGDLQGNIKATAKVFEADGSENAPIWRGEYDISWPKDGPLDSNRSNELTVRKRLLSIFAERLVGCFYDHRSIDKPIRSME